MELDKISGIVTQVAVYNKEDGWGFGLVKDTNSNLIKFNGCVSDMYVGMHVHMSGMYVQTKKYGTQFKVIGYVDEYPQDVIGILTYLENAKIKGIGKIRARKLVDHFGKDLINVLDNAPERLSEVKGLSNNLIAELQKGWSDNTAKRDIYIKLHSYGITRKMADRLFEEYGLGVVKTIKANPYLLADDIEGVGFKRADDIAYRMGFDMQSVHRYMSMIDYTLKLLSRETGSCYFTYEEISEKILSGDIVSVRQEYEFGNTNVSQRIKEAIAAQIKLKHIMEVRSGVQTFYCLSSTGYSEITISEVILKILEWHKENPTEVQVDTENFKVSSEGFHLSEKQIDAVKLALTESVCIITGGPGVGKTTIIRSILDYLEQNTEESVAICAPTGRAAKRVQELTGRSASTIHRLLDYNPELGEFGYNKANKFSYSTVIIEESSMIDNWLMGSLLSAVPESARLIIVGDVDQLPSIGAGNVLSDLINSQKVPVVVLDTIFRQSQGSSIVNVAHEINKGNSDLQIVNRKDSDICFIRNLIGREHDTVPCKIQTTLLGTLQKILKIYKPEQIQILSPQKRTEDPIGSTQLNLKVQELLNPNVRVKYISYGLYKFAVNDRVMHIKNNYALGKEGIFNGDIGFVTDVDTDENIVTVSYPEDVIVEYTEELLKELTLAYACTIHKSQGSEYPVVIIPCSTSHRRGFSRKLLYTATTRGKILVVYVGEDLAFKNAVLDKRAQRRITFLKERLRGTI